MPISSNQNLKQYFTGTRTNRKLNRDSRMCARVRARVCVCVCVNAGTCVYHSKISNKQHNLMAKELFIIQQIILENLVVNLNYY